ncbi:MAG: alkaline phosphatase, partial [Opitutae bacterium]|nr:alkaline phosphatase [Opitutae bacterium]
NIHTAVLLPGSIFGYNEKPSFGVLNFHTGLEDPEIQFEIVSIDDELIYAHTLSLSQLSYPGR